MLFLIPLRSGNWKLSVRKSILISSQINPVCHHLFRFSHVEEDLMMLYFLRSLFFFLTEPQPT